MNYPVWDVPFLGSGWVIGMIAIFHVMVSHFAVGGGLYLAMAESKARREGLGDWITALKMHSKFFLVLTGVYGAVTGVAIWFAIGLAHPEGTSALIHNFVFGWAIEWVFFMVELSAAAVYYYTWDRVPAETHQRVGWLYAIASVLTLVIINGILTFMLTPGAEWLAVAGTGQEASRFWNAFFNPTYWPGLLLRMLVCSSFAGIFALITCSRLDSRKQPALKKNLIRWSCRWLFPSFILLPPVFLWYLSNVPEDHRALLQLGISTIGVGAFTMVTRMALVAIMASATILAVTYFLAYLHPEEFRIEYALAVLFLAALATGATEHSREMLRKPYVIGGYMFSNGVRKMEVARRNEEGYLAHSLWTRPPAASPVQVLPEGRMIFLGQCNACHTLDGYRSMRQLVAGRDKESLHNVVKMLRGHAENSPYRSFMPPFVGTEKEAAALVDYLFSLSPAHP
jgi:cytochrome bd-type quinol oxidase subunit 1